MRESTGPLGKKALMQSIVLQPAFADQLRELNPIQFRSAINSFLSHDPLIRLTVRIWLNVLKMPFVPLAFSKMILLSMLRGRSSNVLRQIKGKVRRKSASRARKLMKKLRIM